MKKTLTHPRGKAREETLPSVTALNVVVPMDLHTRICVRAAQERVSIKELVTEAMQWFLDSTKAPANSPVA